MTTSTFLDGSADFRLGRVNGNGFSTVLGGNGGSFGGRAAPRLVSNGTVLRTGYSNGNGFGGNGEDAHLLDVRCLCGEILFGTLRCKKCAWRLTPRQVALFVENTDASQAALRLGVR